MFTHARTLFERAIRRAALSRHKPDALTGAVCLSMVRNEQDVIEPFLRHNAPFFDAMVVIDHASADRTRDILVVTARELGNVVVTDWVDPAQVQGRLMTAAMRAVQRVMRADVIAFLDADEFLCVPENRSFADLCRDVPLGWTVDLPWRTFLPDPDRPDPAEDPLARMTRLRRDGQPERSKVAIRLGGQMAEGLTVGHGNHVVRKPNGRGTRSVRIEGLAINHMPVRSLDQFLSRGRIGWHASQMRPDRRSDQSWHRRTAIELAEKGPGALDHKALCLAALGYARREPATDLVTATVPAAHGIDLRRKHSDGSYGNPDALVAAALSGRPVAPLFRPDPALVAAGATLDAPPLVHAVAIERPGSVLLVGADRTLQEAYLRHLAVPVVSATDWNSLSSSGQAGQPEADLVICHPAEAQEPVSALCLAAGLARQSLLVRGVHDISALPPLGFFPAVRQSLLLRAIAGPSDLYGALTLYRRTRVSGDLDVALLAAVPIPHAGSGDDHPVRMIAFSQALPPERA